MKKRPKNLDNKCGWCSKDDHGVIIFPKEGCHKCKEEKKRKKNGLCCARLHHGPGHCSSTYCQNMGPHKVHSAIYGCYDQEMEWKGMRAFTGYFDEPK
jgi:hypothetical protein